MALFTPGQVPLLGSLFRPIKSVISKNKEGIGHTYSTIRLFIYLKQLTRSSLPDSGKTSDTSTASIGSSLFYLCFLSFMSISLLCQVVINLLSLLLMFSIPFLDVPFPSLCIYVILSIILGLFLLCH